MGQFGDEKPQTAESAVRYMIFIGRGAATRHEKLVAPGRVVKFKDDRQPGNVPVWHSLNPNKER